MNDQAKQYITRIMLRVKGDDLERALTYFRGQNLDEQHEDSGHTKREIIQSYEQERKQWNEAMDWLQGVK